MPDSIFCQVLISLFFHVTSFLFVFCTEAACQVTFLCWQNYSVLQCYGMYSTMCVCLCVYVCLCVCVRACVCLCVHGEKKVYKKMELSLAKNSHWELCGARPGSSTVVVNSISFATLSVVQFWHK